MKDEVSSVKRKRLASLICDMGLEGDGFVLRGHYQCLGTFLVATFGKVPLASSG